MRDTNSQKRCQKHEQRIVPTEKAEAKQVYDFVQHENTPAKYLAEPVSLMFGNGNGHV